MSLLNEKEPGIDPDAMPVESIVPACMFAPDPGFGDDPPDGEGFDDGEGTNGESGDHLNFSSKVGPCCWFRLKSPDILLLLRKI